MSSFLKCLEKQVGKIENNKFKRSQINQIKDEYNQIYQSYLKGSNGDAIAAQKAATRYAGFFKKRIEKENQANVKHALQVAKFTKEIPIELKKRLENYNNLTKASKQFVKKPTYAQVVNDLLMRTDSLAQSIARREKLKITDFIEKYRSKLAGLTQNEKGLQEVVRLVSGDKIDGVDPQATLFAKEIKSVFDNLHQMYDEAGGIIGKLEYYYPQKHEPQRILKAAKAAGKTREEYKPIWISKVVELADPSKMINPKTGLPYTQQGLLESLNVLYDEITTNGLSTSRERAMFQGNRPEAFKEEAHSRFIKFKDGASFLEYNRQFGSGDEGLFDNIIHKIDSMSQEIATLKNLSPKANNLMKQLNIDMDMEVAQGNMTSGDKRFTNGMYDVFVGSINYHNGTFNWFYRMLEGQKNLMRAGYLTLASVSAMTDFAFVRSAARMNGLPGTKAIMKQLKLLSSKANREAIKRHIFVSDSILGQSFKAARMAEDATSSGGGKIVNTTKWLSSFTNRAGGLQFLTDMGKGASMINQMGAFADIKKANTKWQDLEPAFREQASKFGITKNDFELMKLSEVLTTDGKDGTELLRGQEIAQIPLEKAKKLGYKTEREIIDVSYKFDSWITDVANKSVNESNLRTQAITTGAGLLGGEAVKKGSIGRSALSSVTMFKGFTITVMNNFVLPLLAGTLNGKKDKMAILSSMLVLTTVLGAGVIQAKAVLKGQTPRDMEEENFWWAAMMQGGSLGLFGDFIFGNENRHGQDFMSQMLGPAWSLNKDIFRLSKGTIDKLADSDSEVDLQDTLSKTFSKARSLAPGTPYTKFIMDRLVGDGIDMAIYGESKFNSRMRKKQRKLKSQFGNEFYFEPGTLWK